MKRPTTLNGISPAASAPSLTLAPTAAPVLHLPARVPLDAPTIPDGLVRPWERAVSSALMLGLVVVWFLSTPGVAT